MSVGNSLKPPIHFQIEKSFSTIKSDYTRTLSVGVTMVIPGSFFGSADILNYRLFAKRSIYILHIVFELAKASFDHKSAFYYRMDGLVDYKPPVIVTFPGKFSKLSIF